MIPKTSKLAHVTCLIAKPMVAVVAGTFLFGCSTFTGPGWMLTHSDYLGIEVQSASPPFKVISYAGVRAPEAMGRSDWTFERLESSALVLHKLCFGESCWTVAALPEIADAARYQPQNLCDSELSESPACQGRDWKGSLCQLNAASDYLLDRDPLALDVEIYLIPETDGIQDSIVRDDKASVPLTFVFQYPSYEDTSEYSGARRSDALARIMSKIWHEIQHAEYFGSAPDFKAAHKELALIAENEANSVCWEHAAEAVMARLSGRAVELTRISDKDRTAMQQVFGDIRRTNVSAVVPMLVENKLVELLAKEKAGMRFEPMLRINAEDTFLIERLVTFCRDYSPKFTGEGSEPIIWIKSDKPARAFDSDVVLSNCSN